MNTRSDASNDIAIVGMAAHLPGAANPAAYWANLRQGIESIRRLSETELLAVGESPERMRHRNYVPAAAVLDGFEQFDADFFGFSPKEAAIMDPQHRQFLEVAWEALENAGHPPERFPGPIAVYAGCGMGSYFYFNICSNPDLVASTGMFLLRHTGNDKDFLSTRVSHIFDLKGPSVNIQTACSTSLVAVHYACQALLGGECDMALAGGVTIELPHARGYLFQEGEILSPDGHCHAFDHRAQGTVFGSGAGVVVLRRLDDALRDGDHIWAVIKGTAVNNDGAAKAGYLAPSVDGQAKAIAEAQAVAGVSADTIDYVECHGTGTYLGDPIEVAALTQAFRETTPENGFCRIGSVKTNIGHTDTAAGVAGLIKVALALKHQEIPPSLGYERPNPSIDFETSPFQVNHTLSPWVSHKGPRRAGVNSLGVGGTNAHAVLEEAPVAAASDASDWPFQVLVVSGRSRAAVDANARALAAHLRAHPEQDLADVAFTLKEGRRAFEHRRVLVAASHEEAATLLEGTDTRRVFTHNHLGDDPEVVFMFPGGGAQYAGMARELYATEPVFQDWMDRGLDVLQQKLDYDIRALWLPEAHNHADAVEKLKRPSVQLPLIMIVEYALAQLWMSWGVKPSALVGHSMGENTAACLAGVMSFEDCIGLVLLRGQLFDTVPPGGMLSVPLAASEVRGLLGTELDMASVNAPELCVVSGPQSALDALEATLRARDVEPQRIQIDIAAHSRMLEPILGRFEAYLRSIRLSAPQLPIISNRDGQPLSAGQATDPLYWVGHLRNTVNFADCMDTLKGADPKRVYLEVGPGKALGSLAQANAIPSSQVINSLRHPDHQVADDVWFLGTLGRLWANGVPVDWEPIWGEARRRRVPLPTYAFQRKPYFIEPGKATQAVPESTLLTRTDDVGQWGYQPRWRPRQADVDIDVTQDLANTPPQSWLVFMDETGLGDALVQRLRAAGHRVTAVRAGDVFARVNEQEFLLAPERGREGYDELVRELMATGHPPQHIVHAWLVTREERFRPGSSFFHRNIEQGFFSLLFLAQALVEENLPKPLHLTVLSTGAVRVRDEALPYPEKATLMGPARVAPRELPGMTCTVLDLVLPTQDNRWRAKPQPEALGTVADRVLEDLFATPGNRVAALRGDKRFELGHVPLALPETTQLPQLPEGAVCFITGGLGGIGLTVAERLAREKRARLVLLARQALPAPETWDTVLRGPDTQGAQAMRIRAVRRLQDLGAEVQVIAADVCNVNDMQAAVEQARQRFGRIHLVVHAAGVVDDGPLLTKTSGAVEEVFAAKVHGLQILHELFPDGSIDQMVLFSSTSTVIAPAGQVDYVAANEYLNAYAHSRAAGRTRVLAIDWGIWNEVGMAAKTLASRLGESAPAPRHAADSPLFDETTFDAAGHRLFTATWRTEDLWILDGHRTASGQALLPGTGYLELAAQALRGNGEKGPFAIHDLYFFRPLEVNDGQNRGVRVKLARSEEGYALEVRSDVLFEGRQGFQLNAQATLVPGPQPQAQALDIAALTARCPQHHAADPAGLRSPQEEHLNFGPRWRVLHSVAYGENEGIARLQLPAAFHGDLQEGFMLHPALLDLATGWAMRLIAGYAPDHLWVPVSYREVRVHKPLPAHIWSWVRNAQDNRADAPFAVFDVTLCDEHGEVCVEVLGFSIKRLSDGGFAASASRLDARELVFDESARADAHSKLSPAEELLQHNIEQGIRPAEGADAFGRALATGLPQVVVSSMNLDALVRQASQAVTTDTGSGQKFQRPDLDSDYVEPRNDVERTLVGFWEELLGVNQVGVEDSFFDLGGHSLIAVRLFAMVKKAYRVEFPISVLFEAPTIALCAGMIRERIGDTGTTAEGADNTAGTAPASSAPRRRFTHLVAMHDGEGGERTPFFLVAGMFGNVLNLRHLARLIGVGRPFYGLQARGLYGDQAPHATLVEAATDYIAEMRQVQPHGPYLLGGFSGGGITAYEIARQLEAAGEKVSLLVLLDTPLPMRPSLSRPDKALIKLADLRKGGFGFLKEWVQRRIAWELQRRRGDAAPTASAHQLHNAEIEAAFRAALPTYPLKSWDGPAVLFRPPLDRHWKVTNGRWVSAAREYVFDDNDWTRYMPALRVIEVPGDHDSMVLEPNVRVLASHIRNCINDAESLA
ncbi:type I polyketide synthase [Hydrogenophaga laconesensis]|uniref:Acyl transferase domain-containing protein/thioesterase domain-containing protein n=1 Tax=Hydrogenophaga laconesensis TaxID=1805971 RepID=A0ABU1V4H4_9BURK|nr:type I polyketide synthase [Hydrogenophaga laconesensis]MDR7092355.1 acyl transferase domain-containing protein/thioesterase domain-containing protein [Hydrogenophaga laconesensis]